MESTGLSVSATQCGTESNAAPGRLLFNWALAIQLEFIPVYRCSFLFFLLTGICLFVYHADLRSMCKAFPIQSVLNPWEGKWHRFACSWLQ